MSAYYKTAHNKQPNFNNFFKKSSIGNQEEKRTISAVSHNRQRVDKVVIGTNKINKQHPYSSKLMQGFQFGDPIIIKSQNIISGVKKGENKSNWKTPKGFQQTNFNFQESNQLKNRIQQKFYETVTDGFLQNQRPISKQQPRIKRHSLNAQKLIIEHKLNNNSESFKPKQSTQLQQYLSHSQKFSLNDRPQTSKGIRKKIHHPSAEIAVMEEDKDDLLINNNQLLKIDSLKTKKKQQQNFPIRTLHFNQDPTRYNFNDYRKLKHPISAHINPKQNLANKPKKFEQLIKLNTNEIKKSNSQLEAPFQTSIDQEFLGLFANKS